MNRRKFLLFSGLAVGSILLDLKPLTDALVQVEAMGKLYRGSVGGNILISADAGKTWAVHTRFGSENDILRLFKDQSGTVYASLIYQGHPFRLKLSNSGKAWVTA